MQQSPGRGRSVSPQPRQRETTWQAFSGMVSIRQATQCGQVMADSTSIGDVLSVQTRWAKLGGDYRFPQAPPGRSSKTPGSGSVPSSRSQFRSVIAALYLCGM